MKLCSPSSASPNLCAIRNWKRREALLLNDFFQRDNLISRNRRQQRPKREAKRNFTDPIKASQFIIILFSEISPMTFRNFSAEFVDNYFLRSRPIIVASCGGEIEEKKRTFPSSYSLSKTVHINNFSVFQSSDKICGAQKPWGTKKETHKKHTWT